MLKIPIKHNQSVLDLSIQAFGTVEALIENAFENNLSVTDELIEGNELQIPKYENEQTNIVSFYNKQQLKPATALSDADFTIVEIESCNLCNCFK